MMNITDNGKNNKIELPKNIKNVQIKLEGNNNLVEIEEGVTIFKELHVNIADNNCTLRIGKNTTIYKLDILINEDNNKVEIGKDCMISDNVRILASDSHSIILMDTRECINAHKDGIKIGDHVWIGVNALILKDTKIGNNCIIAAGAIVTSKNKKDNVLLAGNPAKIIKNKVSWERKTPKKEEVAKEVELKGEEVTGNLMHFIEKKVVNKKTLKELSGWAYINDFNSLQSEIYFEIQGKENSKIYKANMYERKDIAKSVGNDNYINSGFNIVLPDNLKLNKLENINILIKNSDKIYKTEVNL